MALQSLNPHKAKLTGSLYFIALGFSNFGFTILNGHFRPLDVVILVLSALPLLVNKRLFTLLFGLIAGFMSVYIGIACLVFNFVKETGTSQTDFMMGYLLAFTCLLSSLLLVYAALRASSQGALKLS
ncbi:MAG: hypothetical protein V4594_22905 [Bacteroidota bacterium]